MCGGVRRCAEIGSQAPGVPVELEEVTKLREERLGRLGLVAGAWGWWLGARVRVGVKVGVRVKVRVVARLGLGLGFGFGGGAGGARLRQDTIDAHEHAGRDALG